MTNIIKQLNCNEDCQQNNHILKIAETDIHKECEKNQMPRRSKSPSQHLRKSRILKESIKKLCLLKESIKYRCKSLPSCNFSTILLRDNDKITDIVKYIAKGMSFLESDRVQNRDLCTTSILYGTHSPMQLKLAERDRQEILTNIVPMKRKTTIVPLQ